MLLKQSKMKNKNKLNGGFLGLLLGALGAGNALVEQEAKWWERNRAGQDF